MLRLFKKAVYYVFLFPAYKIRLGSIGIRSRLERPLLTGAKNIFIGNKVFMQKGGWLAAQPVHPTGKASLFIGDNTYIGHFAHIYATQKIVIEEDVLIANKVYIGDNQHQYQDISVPIVQQPVIQLNPVIIKRGAWLAENVCVMGASVGKNSVVGANSIVTRDIPDYCVAVGSPAKIVKRYHFEKKRWCRTDSEGNFTEK